MTFFSRSNFSKAKNRCHMAASILSGFFLLRGDTKRSWWTTMVRSLGKKLTIYIVHWCSDKWKVAPSFHFESVLLDSSKNRVNFSHFFVDILQPFTNGVKSKNFEVYLLVDLIMAVVSSIKWSMADFSFFLSVVCCARDCSFRISSKHEIQELAGINLYTEIASKGFCCIVCGTEMYTMYTVYNKLLLITGEYWDTCKWTLLGYDIGQIASLSGLELIGLAFLISHFSMCFCSKVSEITGLSNFCVHLSVRPRWVSPVEVWVMKSCIVVLIAVIYMNQLKLWRLPVNPQTKHAN